MNAPTTFQIMIQGKRYRGKAKFIFTLFTYYPSPNKNNTGRRIGKKEVTEEDQCSATRSNIHWQLIIEYRSSTLSIPMLGRWGNRAQSL
ncbi:hypothetical protein CDAR_243341 [Caerostris darwini]|uniref:Uncharacterized protein n=1 Tax=Caerostris darwini TaxID=1538125 RepID=A0AAV4MM39_9ARAC|nr:hypothetical protein CDAR_243341 [Caerostris darwini]